MSKFCFYNWSLFILCSLAPCCIHSFSLSSSSPPSPHRHRHRHRHLVVLQSALSLGHSKKKIQKYHHHHGHSITSIATSKPRHLHVFSPFQQEQEEETSPTSPSPAAAAASQDDNQKDDKDNDNDGMITLHFCAKQTFTSEPNTIFSSSSSIGVSNHLARFLIDESNEIQNLLLGGGTGSTNLPLKLSTDESILLLDEWKKQAQMVGAQLPNVQEEEGQGDDAVYQVKTGGINFAGLRVQSNALIGVKLVMSDMVPANFSTGDSDSDGYSNDKDEYKDLSHHDNNDDGDSPCLAEYQLVYIKDEQYVDGPRVLVWIFNKLTGKNSNTGSGNGNSGSSSSGSGSDAPSSTKQQSVSSFSRFYVNITNDNMAIFTIESMLDIAIKFPTFLLKILPVSKEKAEEQGSASVLKTLVKDTGASLQRVVDYYKKQVALVEQQQ